MIFYADEHQLQMFQNSLVVFVAPAAKLLLANYLDFKNVMSTSTLMRRYGDTDFVTGMRFVAITMVVMIHTGAFVDVGGIGQSITDNGKFGVQIFFVIAGFTIYQNLLKLDYKSYLLRRFFRVVPVYYIFTLLGFIFLFFDILQPNYWMENSRANLDFYNFFMHISLLSSWDAAIAPSILGVEWTIPVEVFWYIFLPLIIMPTDGAKKFVFAFIFLGILSYFGRKIFGPDYLDLGSRFLPLKYGLYFYLGYLSGFIRRNLEISRSVSAIGCSLSLILYLYLMANYRASNDILFGLLAAILIVCTHPNSWTARILTIKPFLILGSVSYSIYLIHMIVIYFADEYGSFDALQSWNFFLFVYAITFFLSALSYKYFEIPFNYLGRRFSKLKT